MSLFREKMIRNLALVALSASAWIRVWRPKLWRWWYNHLAQRDQDGELLFMNYGYLNSNQSPIELTEKQQPYRHSIQLYEHVVETLDMRGCDVLEVGCGRGGGLDHLAMVKQVNQVIGVDLSPSAIAWCRENARFAKSLYLEGSADSLPLDDESIDVAVNVESSHCYPSFSKFVDEVYRVLKPGGYFAFCDLRVPKGIEDIDQVFKQSRFVEIKTEDISPYVVAALEEISPSREAKITEIVPKKFQALFREFAAVTGTKIHRMLKSGQMIYTARVYQKPDSVQQ